MKRVLQIFSLIGLLLVIVPALFVFAGWLVWQTHANLMLAGTVLWFVTAPLWMGREKAKG